MLGKLFKYELRSGALPVPFMLLALGIVYLLGLLADALKISQMKTTMAVALVLIGVEVIRAHLLDDLRDTVRIDQHRAEKRLLRSQILRHLPH